MKYSFAQLCRKLKIKVRPSADLNENMNFSTAENAEIEECTIEDLAPADHPTPLPKKPKKHKAPYSLDLYFGIPGAGKTTFAAYLARKALKAGYPVYSNVPIKGCMIAERSDLGKILLEKGLLIWDEAGLDYDNRKMKMNDDEIYFFKYHRHYQMDVAFFSQGLDVDIKIRKLARHIYLVKPSLIPFHILRREICRRVGIDDMTHQIIDEYFFRIFGSKRIFAPFTWRSFDTYQRKEFPNREFEYWYEDSLK